MAPQLSVRTRLWRALRKRCARCGERGIFRTYFRLHERCPTCGYKFERDQGAWMGVYLLNYAAVSVVIVALIAWYVYWLSDHDRGGTLLPVILGVDVVAVVLGIAFYPIAKSLWAAIALAMKPLEPVEEAEAALFTPDPRP